MDASIAATLIGSDFAAGSIVIVFHMFSMQRWLDRSQRTLDDASRISRTTGVASVDRDIVREDCAEVARRFPLTQVLALGTAVLVMCSLAGVAGWDTRKAIPLFHTLIPSAILLALYVATTFAYRREGLETIREAREYLGDVPRRTS